MKKIKSLIVFLVIASLPLLLFCEEPNDTETKKRSGYRGSIFSFYYPNLNNTNVFLNGLGFDSVNFLTNVALEGKIEIVPGSDIYLSAMASFPFYGKKQQVDIFSACGCFVTRYLEYAFMQGAVGVDKKYPLYDNIDAFAGLSFGMVYKEMEIAQTDSWYFWDINQNDTTLNFSYRYGAEQWYIQPRASLHYYAFRDNFIKMEVGYIYDFLNKTPWMSRVSNRLYHVQDAPKANFNGFTVSLGLGTRF
jgi:hypothetical protein